MSFNTTTNSIVRSSELEDSLRVLILNLAAERCSYGDFVVVLSRDGHCLVVRQYFDVSGIVFKKSKRNQF